MKGLIVSVEGWPGQIVSVALDGVRSVAVYIGTWLTASDRVGGVGVFHVKQSVNLAGGCGVGVIVWVNLGWGR